LTIWQHVAVDEIKNDGVEHRRGLDDDSVLLVKIKTWALEKVGMTWLLLGVGFYWFPRTLVVMKPRPHALNENGRFYPK
jgi:hypothetical protein